MTKVLKIRRTGHVIESLIRNPNKFCPDFGQLDYENDLVAIQHVFPHKGYFHGFNFLLRKGTRTNYPPARASPSDWKTVRLHDHFKDQVCKIEVHANNNSTVGMIKLFALDGTLLLSAGNNTCTEVKDFKLQPGEHIIGVQGYAPLGDKDADIKDIQFVIGRLE